MNEMTSIKNPSLSIVCEHAVAGYKNAGKLVQAPAIRKVIESVIRQKSEHVAILQPLDSLFSGTAQVLTLESGSDPENILKSLVVHELAFAESLDGFSPGLANEDERLAIKAVADASRKFASWAQDHLDLLAMF